jgi:hypothetical protein
VRKLALVVFAVLAVPASAFGARPLTVQTSVSPAWLYFADAVTARVDVLVDSRQVDPRSVQLGASFAPWQQIAPAGSATERSGAIVRLTYRFHLACLAFACIPASTVVQPFRLRSLTITARRLDGSSVALRRAWPVLHVAGRFPPPTALTATPTLITRTVVPAATYRFNATLLAWVLDGVGGIVIAVALGFGAVEFARWRSGRRDLAVDTRPPLARSLALVREAQSRDPEDRRRAVGLLARTLPPTTSGLTSVASEVAWSLPEPLPDDIENLVRAVEAELGGPE